MKTVILFIITFNIYSLEKKFLQDPTPLPPMPNKEENQKTIIGIDSNENGIRDDVEIWISKKFPDKENYNFRILYMSYAWSYQKKLKLSEKEVNEDTISRIMSVPSSCSFYLQTKILKKVSLKASRYLDELELLTLNTPSRKKHDLKISDKLNGKSIVIKSNLKYYSEFCNVVFKEQAL